MLIDEVIKGLEKFQDYQKHMNTENVFFPTDAFIQTDEFYEGKCKRYLYYKKKNYIPDKFDYSTLLKFEVGKNQEQSIIRALQKQNMWIDNNIKIYFNYKNIFVSGEVDAIIQSDLGKQILEIKTGEGYYFTQQIIYGYKQDPGLYRDYLVDQYAAAPKIEHILQTALYLHYFKNITPKLYNDIPITSAQILYYDNANGLFKNYILMLKNENNYNYIKLFTQENDQLLVVPIKNITVESILDGYVDVYNSIKNNVIPDKSYKIFYNDVDLDLYYAEKKLTKKQYNLMKEDNMERMDFHCRYCVYKTQCIKDSWFTYLRVSNSQINLFWRRMIYLFLLFIKIYILITLISILLSYFSLFNLPKFYNKPTFYENYKESLIEDNIPLTFKTKYLVFFGMFMLYNLAWFMMIPASITIIRNYVSSK